MITSEPERYPYEVRRPIRGGPERWHTAITISRHRTESGAWRSLRRQQAEAFRRKDCSQDAICFHLNGTWFPVIG